jgi:putative hydrolase of HD superfamily
VGDRRDLLDLLLEVQSLDRLPRTGYLLRGVRDPESIAEHQYQLALLVWLLAGRERELDRGRAVEMALLHDLAELRTGDLPRTATGYFGADAKHAAERAALEDLLAPADGRALDVYAEYRRGESAEARFVRDCDKLQLMLKVTVYEAWGDRGMTDFWDHPENFPGSEFGSVRETFEALAERRALRPSP